VTAPSRLYSHPPVPWDEVPEILPANCQTLVACDFEHVLPSDRLQIDPLVSGRPAAPIPGWPDPDPLTSREGGRRFLAVLPPLREGDRVVYTPRLIRSGLPHATLPTRELIAASSTSAIPAAEPVQAALAEASPRFQWASEFLGALTIQLARSPESFGTAPDGLRITWYVASGEIRGPRLNATVRGEGGDWMLVRQDGVGLADVRITYETAEGALLLSCYGGVFDLGEEGYSRALRQDYDAWPPLVLAPRFITSHPNWLWLNRLQCIAVGRVTMRTLQVRFDLYAVRVGVPLVGSGLENLEEARNLNADLPGQRYYPT
jgi:hypothetical protein